MTHSKKTLNQSTVNRRNKGNNKITELREHATQWPKEKGQKKVQRFKTNLAHETKDRVT